MGNVFRLEGKKLFQDEGNVDSTRESTFPKGVCGGVEITLKNGYIYGHLLLQVYSNF
jgi:hypothetical protein